MSKQIAARTREKWVDDVKVIACILVAVGHFFMSMVQSGILPDSNLHEWFITTIYYFHVPLFFICSGYLYQKYSKVDNVESWHRNVAKKALALGVPYATFTTATWILKKVFSSSINNQIGGLGDTLFLHPTAPYWYLYALFFIFLVTPTFNSVKAVAVGLVVALAAKGLILTGGGYGVYAVSTVLINEIWFVLGMSICAFNVQLKGRKVQGILCLLLRPWQCTTSSTRWIGKKRRRRITSSTSAASLRRRASAHSSRSVRSCRMCSSSSPVLARWKRQ